MLYSHTFWLRCRLGCCGWVEGRRGGACRAPACVWGRWRGAGMVVVVVCKWSIIRNKA